MQVTHEEARKLIQFNADGALNSHEKTTLYAHLNECLECRAYAEDIQEVERILLPAMKRQWDLQPVPLSIVDVVVKRDGKNQANIFLAIRKAAIGVIVLTFIFSVWQFTLSSRQTPIQLPASVLPVPTPSIASTSTRMLQNCAEMVYIVQKNDTLESIAYQFSVSKEKIMAANHLKTETVTRAMPLIIPMCSSTPTGTVEGPATLTMTYTPPLDLMTFTPDG